MIPVENIFSLKSSSMKRILPSDRLRALVCQISSSFFLACFSSNFVHLTTKCPSKHKIWIFFSSKQKQVWPPPPYREHNWIQFFWLVQPQIMFRIWGSSDQEKSEEPSFPCSPRVSKLITTFYRYNWQLYSRRMTRSPEQLVHSQSYYTYMLCSQGCKEFRTETTTLCKSQWSLVWHHALEDWCVPCGRALQQRGTLRIGHDGQVN